MQWINYRVRIVITDGRQMVGNLLAFDKHMNIVLSDTEEFRKIKPKRSGEPEQEKKRALGMLLLRGENIVSITAEAPPPPQTRKPGEGLAIGKPQAPQTNLPAPPGLAPPSNLSLRGPPPSMSLPDKPY